MNGRLWATATGVAIATTSVVWAEPSLQTQVSARQVEVGQTFQVQVTCSLDDNSESPSAPRLPVPAGVTVQGPGTSTQQSISIVNGQMTRQSSLVLTWNLEASSPGKLRIGPASVIIDGKRLVARPVDITVVPAGAAPRSGRANRRGFPFGMIDPLGGDPFSAPMFPSIPGMNVDPRPELDEIPAHPPELDIDKAKDPTAFLDARALPKRVVIGEQVRLNVYVYTKPGITEAVSLQEPSLEGFLSYRSDHDDLLTRSYTVRIGDQRFFARKILSYALFPTKTGTLSIGPTKMSFASRSLLNPSNVGTERSSEPLTIVVEEPPLAGRPPAYHLGDVGQFTLSATVEPRQIKSGEAVSVQIEVKGTGQLPQKLDPPEQTGIDWLEPSVSQQIDEQQGKIGGSRQFSYVVRLNREGNIDLGEMRLAYFDPSTHRYAFAKAKLGSIEVAPGAAPSKGVAQTDSPAQEPEAPILIARGRLTPVAKLTAPLADRPGFFFWLGLGPAITALFFATKQALSKARAIKIRWSNSTKSLLDAEFEQAKQALTQGSPIQVSSHVERAVHLLIEARTGIRSRGLLRAELPTTLVASGLEERVARSLVDLLERCDELRFVQADPTAAGQLLTDASTRIRDALGTAPARRGATS